MRIKWPADLTRDVPESESFTWSILQEAMFNVDGHLGWRFTAGELRKCAEAAEAAQPAQKRRRCSGLPCSERSRVGVRDAIPPWRWPMLFEGLDANVVIRSRTGPLWHCLLHCSTVHHLQRPIAASVFTSPSPQLYSLFLAFVSTPSKSFSTPCRTRRHQYRFIAVTANHSAIVASPVRQGAASNRSKFVVVRL